MNSFVLDVALRNQNLQLKWDTMLQLKLSKTSIETHLSSNTKNIWLNFKDSVAEYSIDNFRGPEKYRTTVVQIRIASKIRDEIITFTPVVYYISTLLTSVILDFPLDTCKESFAKFPEYF